MELNLNIVLYVSSRCH